MSWFTRRTEAEMVDAYWDNVVRQQPATPVPPVETPPDATALIRRLQTLEQDDPGRPAFADDLLQRLLATYDQKEHSSMPAMSATASLSPPYASPPITRRPAAGRGPARQRRWNLTPALGVALVVLMVLASVAGVWLTYERNDNSHILAPPDATPTSDASPDVPMYRGNPERTGIFPGPGIEGDPVELWRLEFESAIKTVPAMANGVLYVGVDDGTLRALDAASGEAIWTFTASSAVGSSPAVVDGIVYAGSDDGTAYALDAADGSEVWRMSGTQRNFAPVVVGTALYTASDDGYLLSLDTATGEELWRTPLNAAADRSPAVADGVVYQGSADGILHTFDAATGEPGWTFQTEGGGVVATTAIADGVVYQMTFGFNFQAYAYALDAATGEVIWQIPAASGEGFLPPAIGNGRIFISSMDNQVHALDAATGEPIWQFQTGARVEAAPALVGDTLYVAGLDGYLYALDVASGTEYWRYAINGGSSFGPVVSGGVAYVGTNWGDLYAIGGTERTTLAFPGEDAGLATPVGTPVVEPAQVLASPAATGDLATFLWATTGGPESFDRPADLAIAPDGTIWVADGGNSRFQIFTPDGEFVETWGTFGDGEGEFNFIRPNSEGDAFGAVAFAPDGTFYVADMGNQRIQHFDADRQFLHAWGGFGGEDGEFLSPIDVAVDSQGNVFVDDDRRNDIQKFAADGTHLLTFGGLGSEPGQLNFQGWLYIDTDDTVWVVESRNSRVQQFTNDGQFLAMFDGGGTLGAPEVVAVDDRGHIFVADWDGLRVIVLDPNGTVIGEWGPPVDVQIQEMTNIALDGAGNIYVVDYLDGTLLKFQLNPPLVESAATPVAVATPAS